ncbi:hypothetical protein FQN57_000077 [Myotisia sp. PD_48]|nr:hypothetical protein FQN57_000077 [Myotisia sp. PD_48]
MVNNKPKKKQRQQRRGEKQQSEEGFKDSSLMQLSRRKSQQQLSPVFRADPSLEINQPGYQRYTNRTYNAFRAGSGSNYQPRNYHDNKNSNVILYPSAQYRQPQAQPQIQHQIQHPYPNGPIQPQYPNGRMQYRYPNQPMMPPPPPPPERCSCDLCLFGPSAYSMNIPPSGSPWRQGNAQYGQTRGNLTSSPDSNGSTNESKSSRLRGDAPEFVPVPSASIRQPLQPIFIVSSDHVSFVPSSQFPAPVYQY